MKKIEPDQSRTLARARRLVVRLATTGAILRAAMLGVVGLGLPALRPHDTHAQEPRLVPPLFARPIFPPNPAVVDYARYYTTLEECRAAIPRVQNSALWGVRRTNLVGGKQPDLPVPAVVSETARRCGARFALATTPAAELPLLLELALHAGQDSLARAIIARRLELADTTPQMRGQVLRHALFVALEEVRPAKVAWAERLLGEVDRQGWTWRLARLAGYRLLLGYAAEVYDTTRLDRDIGRARALADSLPEAERTFVGAKLGTPPVEGKYARLRAMARGQVVEPTDTVPALPIVADFWFRRPDAAVSRPTRGKLSLVYFVDAGCECHEQANFLLAVHQRVGEALDITLVTHTHGHFRTYPPVEPAEEAKQLANHFFEHLKLPGALAVEVTQFSRLPPPDRGRWNKLSRNDLNYGTMDEQDVAQIAAVRSNHGGADYPAGFLVDRDGRRMRMDGGLLGLAAITGWVTRLAPQP